MKFMEFIYAYERNALNNYKNWLEDGFYEKIHFVNMFRSEGYLYIIVTYE